MPIATPSEEILRSLIHDLRQPLGNLEISVFYLDMVLDQQSDRVREQMRLLARQLEKAEQLLERASADLSVLRGQRDGAASDSLPLTNSATAAVT